MKTVKKRITERIGMEDRKEKQGRETERRGRWFIKNSFRTSEDIVRLDEMRKDQLLTISMHPFRTQICQGRTCGQYILIARMHRPVTFIKKTCDATGGSVFNVLSQGRNMCLSSPLLEQCALCISPCKMFSCPWVVCSSWQWALRLWHILQANEAS